MREKFQINPFDRTALTDYRQLAGRNEEFRQIRFILRNSTKSKNRIKSILISGERGVGKTSFLNLTEAETISNNLIAIRADLTASNSSNSCDFFWHLFNQLINKVFALGLLGGKSGPIDAMVQKIINTDGIIDQANWVFNTPILRRGYLLNKDLNFEFKLFIDDLKLIRKQLIESSDGKFDDYTKIIFLIDESQHLYSNTKLIEEIRFVLQSQELGVGFVFAGDSTYKTSHWEEVFGGSYRDFEIINLPYFQDVESVMDYFRKSLSTINWTQEEIENTLFYRFRVACRHIFQLTSGKPAWINTIASKMFERCMTEEVHELKFDKQAQINVKKMLEDSGELDTSQLSFIENQSPVYEKWLSEIFACELRTFQEIYFYAKFKLVDQFFLSIDDYENFCRNLIDRKILTLIEKDSSQSIGFKSTKNEKEFIDKMFYAFNLKSDAIKQWLQISSNGIYTFSFNSPATRLMMFINDELVTDKFNSVIISFKHSFNDEIFRLSKIIEDLNRKEFDVNSESYETISILFNACKRFEDSQGKEVLFVELKDKKTGKSRTWNIYNYNDKDKVVGFRDSPSTINKIKNQINRYNDSDSEYAIELTIDKVVSSNLKILQNLIVDSRDSKKIGIVLEDKMNELVRQYVRELNLDLSVENANFFYKLFEDGYDLKLIHLNNTAYVFTEINELEKSISLLNEAKRKILLNTISSEETNTALLVFYNLAIAWVKSSNFEDALLEFEALIKYSLEKDVSKDNAEVLKLLILDNDEQIKIIEVKEGDKNYPVINSTNFAKVNIEILKKVLNK